MVNKNHIEVNSPSSGLLLCGCNWKRLQGASSLTADFLFAIKTTNNKGVCMGGYAKDMVKLLKEIRDLLTEVRDIMRSRADNQ